MKLEELGDPQVLGFLVCAPWSPCLEGREGRDSWKRLPGGKSLFCYLTCGSMNLSLQIYEMPHLIGKTVHCDPDVLNPLNSTTSELRMIEHIKFMVTGQTVNQVRSTLRGEETSQQQKETNRKNFTKKNNKSHEYEK